MGIFGIIKVLEGSLDNAYSFLYFNKDKEITFNCVFNLLGL